jgi:hypothetical protein
MKSITRRLFFSFIITVLLISCYPEKKVLVYFPDGRPKVIRHFKRGDSLNERLVSYYTNGKKEYVKYWKTEMMWKDKEFDWYESGAKKSVMYCKYKDTVRTFYPIDSCFKVRGFIKRNIKTWYENGRVERVEYPEKSEIVYTGYNDKGELTYRRTKPIRPDGYDSIEARVYIRRKK